ncbi:MAG TPA: DUF4142 domain-containing protein [Cyclobacteriaceae bacterium]
MKHIVSFLALTFLFACGGHRDEYQYDTNHAEVVDNPGDLKRGDAETNAQAAAKAPEGTIPSPNKAHPGERELPGVKSKLENTFATQAAQAGEGEVALSEMATQKTQNKKIVAFAKTMMKEHMVAGKELKALAEEKGIELAPGCLSCEATRKNLHNLPTADFEREYAKQMVTDHEKAVALFTAASQNERDPELKKWASEKLPLLKHHLAMAKDLARKEQVTATKKRNRKTIRS